jgi:hypothetical protein
MEKFEYEKLEGEDDTNRDKLLGWAKKHGHDEKSLVEKDNRQLTRLVSDEIVIEKLKYEIGEELNSILQEIEQLSEEYETLQKKEKTDFNISGYGKDIRYKYKGVEISKMEYEEKYKYIKKSRHEKWNKISEAKSRLRKLVADKTKKGHDGDFRLIAIVALGLLQDEDPRRLYESPRSIEDLRDLATEFEVSDHLQNSAYDDGAKYLTFRSDSWDKARKNIINKYINDREKTGS